MSNITLTDITYTPTVISNRIDAMITENRNVFVIVSHRRSVSFVYGTIERHPDDYLRCVSPDGLSYSMFHREEIEAVGATCVWIKA